jgi:hypothetical protein
MDMKKLKKAATWGALAAALTYAIAAYAYPMYGPNQELYVTYYSNAARTNEVGVRAIGHDDNCSTWHVTWGITTPYSRVSVTDCMTIEDY